MARKYRYNPDEEPLSHDERAVGAFEVEPYGSVDPYVGEQIHPYTGKTVLEADWEKSKRDLGKLKKAAGPYAEELGERVQGALSTAYGKVQRDVSALAAPLGAAKREFKEAHEKAVAGGERGFLPTLTAPQPAVLRKLEELKKSGTPLPEDEDAQRALAEHILALENESLEDLQKRYYGEEYHPWLGRLVASEQGDVAALKEKQRLQQGIALGKAGAADEYRQAVRDAAREAVESAKKK